jgi:DinB superfamily
VEAAVPRLTALAETETARRRGLGKWSPREIIGHLIDSASNNHQRFVSAQFGDDLVFPGYEQDRWVAAQRYQEAGWPELVSLWRSFNLHLAHVMETVPDETRLRLRQRHNLHEIGFGSFAADAPVTLDGFMHDYVAHLEHHVRQIFPYFSIKGSAATT